MTFQACYDFAVPLSLCSKCLRQTVFEEVPCALVPLQDVRWKPCAARVPFLAGRLWLRHRGWLEPSGVLLPTPK